MKISSLLLASALIAGSAGLAFAQDAPAGGAMAGGGRLAACRDDGQKLCADKRGPDRRACLEANKDKLSDGCKAALTAAPAAP